MPRPEPTTSAHDPEIVGAEVRALRERGKDDFSPRAIEREDHDKALQVSDKKVEKARREALAKAKIKPLLTEEAKESPAMRYKMAYILAIEGDMACIAIETYLGGLGGYPVSRKTVKKVVENTLQKKARPSLPGIPGGGYSMNVVLPSNGRPSKFSPRA